MLNAIHLLLLGTAQKSLITSWSLAAVSLIVVESNPNLPEIVAGIGYIFTGAALAIGCFFLGRLIAQYQEQAEIRDFEAYLAHYQKYQEKFSLLQQRIRNTESEVA